MEGLPAELQPMVYAGRLVKCGPLQLAKPTHKWHDPDMASEMAEGRGDCWPPFMEGPAYMLGERLVRAFVRNAELLRNYKIEDAAVGLAT